MKFIKNKRRRKIIKEIKHFQEPNISDDEGKNKSNSSVSESGDSEEILSSSSEKRLGRHKIFVTSLGSSETNSEKPIKNLLFLFIHTILNYMSIRFCLVSQPNNKFISNSEQLFDATDLSPTISQINPGTTDKNKYFKVCTIKILLDSCTSASIVCKHVLYKHHQILTNRENKWSTIVGTLNTTCITMLN